MPLEFISMVKGFHEPSFDDRGFLMHLTRAQWNNSATSEAMNLLRSYAEPYYEMKCPESKDDPPEEDGSDSESQSKDDASSSSNNKTKKKSYCIKFAVRNLHNNSHCFVACNLADPEDFTNFLFSKLAEDTHDLPKTDMQIRIFPVQRISEAKPRIVEETLRPLLEQTLAKDSYPHRFSLVSRSSFAQGTCFSEGVSIARNCVWAANPNCVQCIKYQDYAVVMSFIGSLFFVGIVREYQRLATCNTLIIRKGVDDREQKPDSEDDISDDPTISEEKNWKRKLRIKRKRRAELNMSLEKSEAKKQSQEADGEGDDKIKREECDNDGGVEGKEEGN